MENLDNLVWIVYLLDVILGDKFEVVLFLFIVMTALGMLGRFVGDEIGEKLDKTFIRKSIYIPTILLFIFQTLAPTTTTAYKMLAVYGGVEIIKSPEVQKLGGKGIEVLNKVLDDYLKEDKTDG